MLHFFIKTDKMIVGTFSDERAELKLLIKPLRE